MNILMEGSVSEWLIVLPENLTAILEELRKDIHRDIRNFETDKTLNISFNLLEDPMSFEKFAYQKRTEHMEKE
jgi:hypothetical protein